MTHTNTRWGNTQMKINAGIKQSIIPEFISGSSTPAVAPQPAWKMLKRVQQLPNFITTKGFTLIELLVVVLIIAILAAVAMPQYQKAVRKAQTREVLVAIDALDKAQASLFLTEPYRVLTKEKSDIEIPTLKYFKYTTLGTGRTPTYDFQAGSSLNYEVQTGSSGAFTLQNVSFTKDGLKLDVYWKHGKLISKHCKSTSKKQPCSDFSPLCVSSETKTWIDNGSIPAYWSYSYTDECDF